MLFALMWFRDTRKKQDFLFPLITRQNMLDSGSDVLKQ